MLHTRLTVAYLWVLLAVVGAAWWLYAVALKMRDAWRAPILPEVRGQKWDASKHHH